MLQISSKKDCCGCTACANICPQKAITMVEDKMGFKYPYIDKQKCVECNLCNNVCAFTDKYDQTLQYKEPLAYAVRHKDIKQIESSRSGAAFVALSDIVLENNGIVYGCALNSDFTALHKCASTKEEREKFKGSKYIQSELNSTFLQIKRDLQDEKIVMFSGTGCQCAGLNAFIGKKLRKNLILIDIVCHGVPSTNVWKSYLGFIEKKYNDKIISVDFREKKKFGWSSHIECLTLAHKGPIYHKDFTDHFYSHISFRPSCGNCHFCNLHRPSDITLADYWGFQRTDANFNADDKGCSLVLINTEKGRELFEKVQKDIYYLPATIPNIMQGHLEKPSKLHYLHRLYSIIFPICGFRYSRKIIQFVEKIHSKFNFVKIK